MATTRKVIDIDAEIRDELAEARASIHSVRIKLFGEEFRVQTDLNLYRVFITDESGDPLDFLHSIIHADDLARFKDTLKRQSGINQTVLAKIVEKIVEAATERPIKSSSGSTPGRTKRASTARSAGVAS
jgi:hypothetical protein